MISNKFLKVVDWMDDDKIDEGKEMAYSTWVMPMG